MKIVTFKSNEPLSHLQTDIPLTNVSYTSTGDTDPYSIYLSAPKVIQVAVDVPEGFNAQLRVKVTNEDFGVGGKMLDLCGGAVVFAGANVPCLDIAEEIIPVYGPGKIVDE